MNERANTLAKLVLPLDAFVRSIAVGGGGPHAFFLGAGASVSSGVPSAEQCVWLWKREIFLSNNPRVSDYFRDPSSPGESERRKIQRWLDSEGTYPDEGSPEEYSSYAEQCYPTEQGRKDFFRSILSDKNPHIGYKILGLLVKENMLNAIWTTN